MCYEFDAFFGNARLAEQIRSRQPKSREAPALPEARAPASPPAAPAEPERTVEEGLPVPA